MDAYIYQAALFCSDCIKPIKERLDKPAKVSNEYSFDSDEYPKGPYGDGGGESDSPQHCSQCSTPLGNELTSDGVLYVLEELFEHVGGRDSNGDLLDGWADQLDGYSLTDEQAAIVETFREFRSQEV